MSMTLEEYYDYLKGLSAKAVGANTIAKGKVGKTGSSNKRLKAKIFTKSKKR